MSALDQRRRFTVALLALIGAGATIATSQAVHHADLERSTSATVVLDADAPRAAGTFVLTLPSAALPTRTSEHGVPAGTVTFTTDPANRGEGTGADLRPPFEIQASVQGTAAGWTESGDQVWPLGNLCALGESCRKEFDVAVEWLQPRPASSVTVSVEASVLLFYVDLDVPPAGASATWEVGQFNSVPPAPALSAHANLGSVTLGPKSLLASRHVLLRGSPAVLADLPGTVVTTGIQSEPSGEDPPSVIVTTVPDASTDQQHWAGRTQTGPFTGCVNWKDCVRGFTVTARWAGLDPDRPVDLDWSFEALARFPLSTRVPAGAILEIEVENVP